MPVIPAVISSAVSHVAPAGGVAGAVAWGAFKYNRGNYIFDQSLRYTRYTTGYSMAIDQAKMYREDIRDLTEITVAKQDLFHIVGVIFFVITFQLIMAGRLGVHGPSPPGWLMGLHWVCCGQAMMWLTLSTWMAMHASARATAGMAHMLTRNVRLPIPTPQQLDKARSVASDYESSKMSDMFRLPFVTPAPADRDFGDEEAGKGGKHLSKSPKQRSSSESGHGTSAVGGPRKLPRWYQEAEDAELYPSGEFSCPTTPEHFELYRGLQQEWWMHDIYGKISLLFFMSHWLHGASFYIQSHAFTELRAIWVGWSCTFVLVSSHYCLLKIDIFSDAAKAKIIPYPIERIAFLTPLLTCLGMSLEYSIIVPAEGIKTLIYIIAWICYIIHVLFAIRLYDISTPTMQAERPDIPGQPWWPSEWWLPTAFQHALYLIAPPKHCEPGQTCLQQEMKIAKKAGQSTVSGKKARETLPPLFAYKIFRGGAQVMIAVWVVIVVGRIIEQIHGERYFFRQEGRAERWPSHMQPWMPPWTRDNSRNEWCHTGGCDRRLSSDQTQVDANVKAVAQKLSSLLTAVSATLDHELAESSKDTHTPSPLHKARVQWPQRVQPSVLACNGESFVAAVTKDAKTGVVMSLQQTTQQQPHVENTTAFSAVVPSAVRFSLQSFENEMVEILGVSWDSTGLILTTASGFILDCAGNFPVAGGVWQCRRVGAPLPSGGSKLKWATVARVASCSRLRAAVVFEGDEVVTIYEQSAGIPDAWLPAGEVRWPHHAANLVSLSLSNGAEELLISSKDGSVMTWPLGGAVPAVAASPRATLATSDLAWRGTCGLGVDRFAHLAWRTNRGKVLSHAAELFISSRRA